MRKSLFASGLCLAFAVLTWCCCATAALSICGKCGYENQADALFCSHCGTSVRGDGDAAEEDADVTPEPAEAPAKAAPEVLSADTVDGDMQAASRSLARKKGWLALFYCENATALNLVARADTNRSDRILGVHAACEQAIRADARACPACGGSGSVARELDTVSSKGERIQHTGPGVSCATCGGNGAIRGKASLAQLAYEYGQASKEYELSRQSLRWVPVGRAWVPPECDGKLNARQIATLKRTVATRCQRCLGFGQITCDECKGAGRMKCPNKKCRNGTIERVTQQGLANEKRSKGAGTPSLRVTCDVCAGAGAIRCAACAGRGSIACSICGGTGKRPVCRTCDGEGLRLCSKCRGTGTYRDAPCDACGACGAILCNSCRGDGRREK